jgi:hypothetical protein
MNMLQRKFNGSKPLNIHSGVISMQLIGQRWQELDERP